MIEKEKLLEVNGIGEETVRKILDKKYRSNLEKYEKYGDDVVLVVPSDHMIKNVNKFIETVKEGEKIAKK